MRCVPIPLKEVNTNGKSKVCAQPHGTYTYWKHKDCPFNYLFVKSGGKDNAMVLRIEDTDLQRSSTEYEKLIYEELKWLGIEWDEAPDKGVAVQPLPTEREADIYNEYYNRLIAEGKAYYCFCTPRSWSWIKRKPPASQAPQVFGTVPELTNEQVKQYLEEGRPATIRLIIDPEKTVVFNDVIKGRIEIDSDTLGETWLFANRRDAYL